MVFPLKEKRMIERLFSKGRRVKHRNIADMSLLVLETPRKASHYLVCLSAKGRTIVLRNRLRRITREIIWSSSGKIRNGIVFAIFPRYSMLSKCHVKRREAFMEILAKAGILRVKLSDNSSLNNC